MNVCSNTHTFGMQVKVEYIGDLATTVYSHNLQSKYLLVPALDDVMQRYRTEQLYRNMTVSASGGGGWGGMETISLLLGVPVVQGKVYSRCFMID